VPLKRVKKRRVIQQPLSSLAVEIIKEALKDSNKDFVFASPLDNRPLNRKAMATALRGTKQKKDGKMVTKTPGICALLGLKPFTPHDLRRRQRPWLAISASMMLGSRNVSITPQARSRSK
jgi:integrase